MGESVDNKSFELIESGLGVKQPNVSREQIQVAYALNLCSVSVSQIIDYNDFNILEQEYETILNNLNLEYMPKDEALLDIIKRLLETITFFRIQEGEKSFIEKDYQQKMKNAIWSAMPNPGALIGAGMSGGVAGLAVSIAASVGTAYMNYRKNRVEYQNEKEKQYWELKKTAIEQFQSLQQQLFETSWRLADKYKFPDILRLSERQIKQYNAILMDEDELRKFERLDSIKHKFAAYPPFWYYFGNTANSIAIGEHYGLDYNGKKYYQEFARKCFEYFTTVNKYDLLREDTITASCYLEYIDLLDREKDKAKIEELLVRAVQSAGNALDVLQLCAVAYMKIGDIDQAAYILRQLVNEQYNEVTNAQLLSSIYVSKYIKFQNEETKNAYRRLETRINPNYLFPLPRDVVNVDNDQLGEEFVKIQRDILRTKYQLVFKDFIRKYEIKINRIIPLPEENDRILDDDIYRDDESAREARINKVNMILYNGGRGDQYKQEVKNILYSYQILQILNEMFASICLLECVQEEYKQLELQEMVKNAIRLNSEILTKADRKIHEDFNGKIYADIQGITLKTLTKRLFFTVAGMIKESVNSKKEMRDFIIAEINLSEFCKKENIPEPEFLYAHADDARIDDKIYVYFTPDLIGNSAIEQSDRIKKNKAMIKDINIRKDKIVINKDEVEFYTQEDARVGRYFHEKRYRDIRLKTLAVLDDRTKGDLDLVFTTEGIMPIIKGRAKSIVAYNKIEWTPNGKKKELLMGVKYSNPNLDMDELKALIMDLAINAERKEDSAF